MLRFLQTKLGRAAALAVVLLSLYALVGFLVVPRVMRNALLREIPETLGAVPSVGAIRFNPFLLCLSIDDFALRGPAGGRLLGFKHLFVAFEVSSLWHRAYSFGEIELAEPFVSAAVAPDGSLNLERMLPRSPVPPEPEPPAATSRLPALRIGSFKVSNGLVTYEDHSRPDGFVARLEPIDFELRDFTTGISGGEFTLSGVSAQGGRLEWHGHLGLQPVESTGQITIEGLRVQTLWEYFQDQLNFTVTSGTIDLAASYRFSDSGLQLDVSNAVLEALAVRPRGGSTDWMSLSGLHVTGARVNLADHRAHVDRVTLDGLKVTAWRDTDGSFNLNQLLSAAATGGVPTPSGAAPPAGVVAATLPAPAWQFDLTQFELSEASLALEDRTTHPTAKLLLAPLNMQLSGITQDLTKPLSVLLDTHLNESGVVSINGQLTPRPLVADASVKLDALDLTVLQPYLVREVDLTLLSGGLGGNFTVHVGSPTSAPAMKIAGDLHVDRMHTVDNALHDDFINWERLDISGLTYSQGPDQLQIAQIAANKPYVRAIIEADDSMNLKRVMTVPGVAAVSPTGAAAAAAPAVVAAVRPAVPAPSHAARGLPISIQKIIVNGGQANFSDLSVDPHFSAGINQLAGSIVNVSSKPGSRATLDLHGQVAAFSPVAITGQFNVLGPKLYTDIDLNFQNISLPIFNPYSGKFAGYDISEGKLSTEFHYKVDGRALDAQHHVIIQQLQFGAKTDSKEAVSLPIKLAVALLKDRNGVIDLSLPVTGTLDDPQFRLGPLIWKVFVNLLEKAVTAPFALLGSMFGAGADIQYIDFEPGRSDLDAAALKKAKIVAQALVERPALAIEVPIAVVPDIDRPALIAAEFDARRKAVQVATNRGLQPFDALPPAAQLDVLTRLYTQEFGASPKLTNVRPDARVGFLGKAIREHIQVSDNELKALGQQRAKALQTALLTDSDVEPGRVFLVGNDKASASESSVRLELTLK